MISTLGLLSQHRGAVAVAGVASTASLLFGYDTGIAGSVIALKRYHQFSTIAKTTKEVTDTRPASQQSSNSLPAP